MTATRRTLTILLAYLLLVALGVAVALPAAADEVPPAVSVDAPSEGQTINTPDITISGTATDDVGVGEVRVRIEHDGLYWTGISWISTEAWLPAALSAPGTTATDWEIEFEQTAIFDDSPPRQGTFTVTARAKDTTAPVATTLSDPRSFSIEDDTPPVISLIGPNPQTVEAPGPYVELGATADDDFDSIAGEAIQIVSNVNASVPGTYQVTYDVSDGAGNAATQVVRTVNVEDTKAPVITLLGDNPQFVALGGTYVEAGATAVDALDGDVTGDIQINSGSVNTSVIGNYFVNYRVTDDAGNMATKLRTVSVVEDTTAPVITVLGDNPQQVTLGQPYVELGATATDNIDGDVTGDIVTDASKVDTGTVGTYEVTYNVSDSSGNAADEKVRTVNVVSDVDTTPPVISLEGANPQLIGMLSPYTELGATATDDRDGDISSSIVIDASGVDTSTAGTYQVTYDVMDTSGNVAVQKVRTVEVVDFFTDDDGIFERVINAIAAAGITRGCNPPANDRYCPNDNVTRGQFSALLARALGYTERADDPFTDDDTNIFEADIEKLAHKGVLRGCNPPANDRVCPDAKLTRGAAAAMFVRALGLTDNGGGDLFDDDDNSVFEDDIDKLATAGITLGCNPPENTEFCPDENITRAQIAAFFARAFDL